MVGALMSDFLFCRQWKDTDVFPVLSLDELVIWGGRTKTLRALLDAGHIVLDMVPVSGPVGRNTARWLRVSALPMAMIPEAELGWVIRPDEAGAYLLARREAIG
jgi:hypothetical protein